MKNLQRLPRWFLCTLLSVSPLQAQTPEGEAAEPEFEAATPPTVSAPSLSFEAERNELLQKLKKEVEPNLIQKDVQRLNQNVMKMGSYREDWAREGQEFLVANAPLAELYLYRYATLNNQRLNARILDTLTSFPTYRFPRATLFFADYFRAEPAAQGKLLTLFEQAIAQEPTLLNDVVTYLTSSLSYFDRRDLLHFGVRVCKPIRAHATDSTKASLAGWVLDAGDVWGRVLTAEFQSCLPLRPL